MVIRSLRWLGWWLLMLALLLTLLLVGVRSWLLPSLGQQREAIAAYLSDRLGLVLQIERLEASWRGYLPELQLGGLSLATRAERGPALAVGIEQVQLALDPWRSLLQWQPVFQRLELNGADIHWRQRAEGWLPAGATTAPAGDAGAGGGWRNLLGLLLSQPQVQIAQAQLTLIPQQGPERTLSPINALLEGAGERHQLSGDLRLAGLVEDTRLSFAIQAFGVEADPLLGHFPFYLKLESLGPELLELFGLELPLQRMRAGTEFWGRWRNGALTQLQGRLAVGELVYGVDAQPLALQNSHLDFALLPLADRYQLQLNDLRLNSGEASWELAQLALEGRWQGGHLVPERLLLPHLDLAPLNRWLLAQPLLPAAVRDALTELNPRGRLENLQLQWPDQGGWRDASLRADSHELAVDAYFGAPAIEGASGLLEADLNGGALHLQSSAFELGFPKLFDEAWSFTRAEGTIDWTLRPGAVRVNSGLLHLGDAAVSAAGRFGIDIPYARDEQTELTLLIGMTDSDGRHPERFTPRHEVGEGLYRWLGRSIQQAHIRQAGFVLHGGTRLLEPRQPPAVQLFFDIDRAQLEYDPAWPAVTDAELFLMIRNGDLRADIRRGRVLDTEIRQGWAYKALQDPQLEVAVRLAGPASDVDQILKSPVLAATAGAALDDWTLSGQVDGMLRLEVPVVAEAQSAPRVRVAADLTEGGFRSDKLRLALTALNGPLLFDSRSGLSSPRLQGRLFDQPIVATIRTEGGVTQADVTGTTPVSTIRQWSGVQALALLDGKLPWSSRLVLCTGQPGCQNRFELSSDLNGVSVDLPGEYGLAADQRASLEVRAWLQAAPELEFSYRDRLRGRFDLGAASTRGTLTLGGAMPALREGTGVFVEGYLQQFRAADLSPLLAGLGASASTANAGGAAVVNPLRRVELVIGRFEAGALTLRDLYVEVEPAAGWRVRLDGPEVAGTVELPQQDVPVRVRLERLLLGAQGMTEDAEPLLESPAGATPATSGGGKALDLTDLPAVDVSIAKLNYKAADWGRWQFQIRPQGNSLRLQQISAQLAQLSLRGEAYWQQTGRGHTGVTLSISGEDIGRQLEAWALEPVIESRELTAQLQLEWPGAPWAFELGQLGGALQFEAREGRLIESGNSANLLRVFGILNFNTLGRRLRLDFSDLFKKGVVFDRLKADYEIERGLATTRSPLEMRGPSADLKASGTLDLAAETVDKQVEVVLPLTSNVPFAAVLLGAPQVAGAVFLIDKLIGDKLERVTTLRYRLSGDWSDPQVELQTQAPANALDGGER